MLDASIVATRIHGFERGLIDPAAEAVKIAASSDGDFIRNDSQPKNVRSVPSALEYCRLPNEKGSG
jgi:hypothetical protein